MIPLNKKKRLRSDIDFSKEYRKPKESVKKEQRALTIKNAIIILKGMQIFLNAFETGIKTRKRTYKYFKSGL